jgi:4-hydroxy-4-methyl-2-oxoglutarate aldolase
MLDEATKNLCGEIGKLRTAIVGDVLREMGFAHQILHTSISGLVRGMKLIGPAFTIRGETFMGGPPKLAPGTKQPKYEMFHKMYRGCVLVYATGGYEEAAAWGDNINISVKHKGCAGVVVDGGVRDAEPIIEAGMPVFGRFITPTSSAPRFGITDYETPVTMTGQTSRHVVVNPGDLVLGDFDGVLVIPRMAAPAMLEAATELARIEEIQFAELARGGDRQTVYEGHSRFGHIKKWTYG